MKTKGVVRIPIDICHHIQRSSFLFATSFSISYSFFFFLSFLSLWDICRRNLVLSCRPENQLLPFIPPTSFVHNKRNSFCAARPVNLFAPFLSSLLCVSVRVFKQVRQYKKKKQGTGRKRDCSCTVA
jgi:hypothetical protein